MRRLRRLTIGFITAIIVVTIFVPEIRASVPSAIENTIKGWFNSAGKLVRLTFSPSTSVVSKVNECNFSMDNSAKTLVSSCNGGTTHTLNSDLAYCDSSGNCFANSYTSADQNLSTLPNYRGLFDNDVNVTPDPTCANLGTAGVLREFDQDESATDLYGICDGTTLVDYVNPVSRFLVPFGAPNGTTTPPADDDDCKCFLFTVPVPLAAIDKLTMQVTTLDADDTLKVGIYNEAGTRQYFEAAVDVTSNAVKTSTNALKLCVGGTNQDVSCAASSECPGGACSTTSPPVPRGTYWFCEGQNVVTASVIVIASTNGGAGYYGASAAITNGCVAGDLPNTLSITKSWGTVALPYVVLSDE